MKKKLFPEKKISLKLTTQLISLIPVIIFAIIITFISYKKLTSVIQHEISIELENNARNLDSLLNIAYPGNYWFVDPENLRLRKGITDLSKDYFILDSYKENTDSEATLFYGDIRVLTTIRDENGDRITGTKASERVVNEVLLTGEPHFYEKVMINDEEYFSYYLPISNSSGEIIGMIFIGKLTKSVNHAINEAMTPIFIAIMLLLVTMSMLSLYFADKLLDGLFDIRRFLIEATAGDLDTELGHEVLDRADEIGDIARSAEKMRKSLRKLIEEDPLTELYNRRFGNKMLHSISDNSSENGKPFCAAIGDIDFFKKVNDTYGHDAGDLVLRTVSNIMRDQVGDSGFVARWGGEEFLVVFEDTTLVDAETILNQVCEKIRDSVIAYNEIQIRVTMTFGVTDNKLEDVAKIVLCADRNLYIGKNNGRDQVVAIASDVEIPEAVKPKQEQEPKLKEKLKEKLNQKPKQKLKKEPKQKSKKEPKQKLKKESKQKLKQEAKPKLNKKI